MTDPLTPEHLAELRRTADSPDWPQCCGPWHDYEISKIDEAAFPWSRVKAAREVADRWHSHAYRQVKNGPDGSTAAWAVAQTVLSLVLQELDDDGMRPHAAPQPGAEPIRDAPVMDFPSEPPPESQRPARGVDLGGELDDFTPEQLTELKRISGYGDPIDGRALMSGMQAPLQLDPDKFAAFDGWIADYWQRREAAEAAAPLVSECGHAPWWLVINEGGVLGCMVCGPSTRPQDSPTATQSAEPAEGDTDARNGPQEPAEAIGRCHHTQALDYGPSCPVCTPPTERSEQ